MTQSTSATRSGNSLISTQDVQGTQVFSPDGSHIGDIDHMMIEKISGKVAYAMMSFGGFMGMGTSLYPVPWGALQYDTGMGGYRTNITEAQLQNAPSYGDNSWADRKWEENVHRHYKAPSYWDGSF